ncbi:TPA: hypothetical protein U2L27_001554 [Acinetobacter baumannii]|nr:hypothetical protein [Acinetobacter baumannii]
MNTKKYTLYIINEKSPLAYQKLLCNIPQVKISPYSQKSEQQRLNELKEKVAEAKAALDTFSYQSPPKLMVKLKKFFFT